jgi:hypothetical protein
VTVATAVVTVTVRDSDGNPIAGASVRGSTNGAAIELLPGVPASGAGSNSSAITDNLGAARLKLLRSGAPVSLLVTPPTGSSFTATSLTTAPLTDDQVASVTSSRRSHHRLSLSRT